MTEQETDVKPEDPPDRTGDDPFDVSTEPVLPQSDEPAPRNDPVPTN